LLSFSKEAVGLPVINITGIGFFTPSMQSSKTLKKSRLPVLCFYT
jgi:hypothetical protein